MCCCPLLQSSGRCRRGGSRAGGGEDAEGWDPQTDQHQGLRQDQVSVEPNMKQLRGQRGEHVTNGCINYRSPYTHHLRPLSGGWTAWCVQVVSWRWRCCCRTTPSRPTAWRLQTRPPQPTRRLASHSAATAQTSVRWPSARTTWPSSPPLGTQSKFGTGEKSHRFLMNVTKLSGGLTRSPAPLLQVNSAGDSHHGLWVRPLLALRTWRQTDHPGD